MALQKSLAVAVDGIDAGVRRWINHRFDDRFGDWNETGVHIGNRQAGESGCGVVVCVESAAGFVVTNGEGSRGIFASDECCSEIREHAKVLDNWHAEDSVDGHVVAQTKGNMNWAAVVVAVWSFVSNDGG